MAAPTVRPGLRHQSGTHRIQGWANYFSYGSQQLAYRAVEAYVEERVRHFLRRRHKMIGQGTRRFASQRIFVTLGVQRLGE